VGEGDDDFDLRDRSRRCRGVGAGDHESECRDRLPCLIGRLYQRGIVKSSYWHRFPGLRLRAGTVRH